ncbi:hypothetical protein CLOM_g22943 [Closterium sp. NIES-68]|nr:hypothetical protein CLOM_g22943 [Closterium sp. NIES-68]GJP57515.1 hypothetical protein CLOP_g12225 [Closterium sp. NIES-67]
MMHPDRPSASRSRLHGLRFVLVPAPVCILLLSLLLHHPLLASTSASPDPPHLARGAPIVRPPWTTATQTASHPPQEAVQIQSHDASVSSASSTIAATGQVSTTVPAAKAAIPAANAAVDVATVPSREGGSLSATDSSQASLPQLPPQTSAAPWLLPPRAADAHTGGSAETSAQGGEGKARESVPMVPVVSASERWVRNTLIAVRQYLTLPDGKKWPPFEPNAKVAAASVLSVVGAALANAGGVGGGGLFVPLFNLLLGYDAKTSTALSKSMIMGGAIASACFNAGLRHPTSTNRPLIDFSIARLMQPMLLLGISIGVLCNVVFPPWLITVMLCVLLSFMTYKTLGKGIATWRKESRINPALSRSSSVSSHASRRPTTPGYQPPCSPYRGQHTAAAGGGGGRGWGGQSRGGGGRDNSSPFSPLPNGHSHSPLLKAPPHRHSPALKPTVSLDSAFACRSLSAVPPASALLSHASLHSYTSLDSETSVTVHDLVDPTSLPAPVDEERQEAPGAGGKGCYTCGGEGGEGGAVGEGGACDAAADAAEDGRAGAGCAADCGDGDAAAAAPAADGAAGDGDDDLRKPLLGRLRGTRADVDEERLAGAAATLRSQCQAAAAAPPAAPRRSLMSGADAVAVAEMVAVWAFFLAVQVVKSSTADCSTEYWLLTAAQVPVAVFATLLTGWRARGRKLWWEPVDTSRAYLRLSAPSTPTATHAARTPNHANTAAAALSMPMSPVPPGTPRNVPPRYDFAREITYPLAALLAGCMGGLLGIGGGMVMGPVLLELNIPPQVTSATSTFIVVFSSSLSVVEFYLLGRIPIKVASYFCLLAMVAAVSGLSIVRSIVIRSGKASIIIFALASVIGSSAIVLGAIGGLHVLNDWKHGEAMGFRPLCNQVW